MNKEKQEKLWDLLINIRGMGKDFDRDLFQALMKTRRYAARYHRLCEQACNGEGIFSNETWSEQCNENDEAFDELHEKAYSDIEKTVLRIFEKLGGIMTFYQHPEGRYYRSAFYDVIFQRDPRGWEIKVVSRKHDQNLSQWIYAKL